MLCEKCHQNQATVQRISIIDGKRTETHLCQGCAGEMPQIQIGYFLGTVLGSLPGHLRCDCGTTFAAFEQTGRLGCSKCYQTFDAQLQPLYRRVHGAEQHTGRAPSSCVPPAAPAGPADRLAFLREELRTAVIAEEFEKAARLRDEIKLLSKEE